MLAIPFLLTAFWLLRGKKVIATETFRRAVIIAAIALVPSAGWGMRNTLAFKRPVMQSTESGFAFWLGNCAHARGCWSGHWKTSREWQRLLQDFPDMLSAPEPRKSQIFWTAAFQDMRDGGIGHFIWLETRKLVLFFYPIDSDNGFMIALMVMFLFVPFGLWAIYKKTTAPTTLLWMAAWIGATLSCVLIVFHDSRYRHTAEPPLIVIAAIGADWLIARYQAKRLALSGNRPTSA
jgi:hypothetical protein